MGDEESDSAKTSSEIDTPETDISARLKNFLGPSHSSKKSMWSFDKESTMFPKYMKSHDLLSQKVKKLHEENILHLQRLLDKQDMVEKLEKRLLEESNRIKIMDDQIKDLSKRNQNLNSIMKEKDEQIYNLQNKNVNLQDQIRELQVRIKKYIIKIHMLKQNIDDAELCDTENVDLSEDLELSPDESDTNEINSINTSVCTHCADLEMEILYQKALRSYLNHPRAITPISDELKQFCSVSIQVNLLPINRVKITDDTNIIVNDSKIIPNAKEKHFNIIFRKILSVFKNYAKKALKDVNSHGFKFTNNIHKVNLDSEDALPIIVKLAYKLLHDVTNSVQGFLLINSKQFEKSDINCASDTVCTRKTKKKKLTEDLFDSDDSDQKPAHKRRKKEEIKRNIKQTSSRSKYNENITKKISNSNEMITNKSIDDQSHVSSGYVSESVSNNDIEVTKSSRKSNRIHNLLRKAEENLYPTKKTFDNLPAKIFMDNLRKGNVKKKVLNINDNNSNSNVLEDILHDMDNTINTANHDEDSRIESLDTDIKMDVEDNILKPCDHGMAEIDDSNCESANEDTGMSETDYLSEDDSRCIHNTKNHNKNLVNEKHGTQSISHKPFNKCSSNIEDKTQDMTSLKDKVEDKLRDVKEKSNEPHNSEESSTNIVSQISTNIDYVKDLGTQIVPVDQINDPSQDTESVDKVENVFRFYTLQESNLENDEGISSDKMQNSDEEASVTSEITSRDFIDNSNLTYEYTKAPIPILVKILEKYSGSWRVLKKQFMNNCRYLEYHGVKEKEIKTILVYYFNNADWLSSIPDVEILLRKVESEHLSMTISFCLLRLMDNNWNDILKNNKDAVQKMVTLLLHLGDEVFLDDILKSLSYEIFRFEKRKDIFIMFLSQVYISLCIKLKKYTALNTLLLDSFYCLQYGCMEITMQLLKVYPSILQVYKHNEKENILHTTIKYYIINCKLMNVKILNELKKKIKYEYKYTPGINNANELLQKIMNEVKRGPNLDLYLSTILLSKQENQYWVINTLVNKGYVELLERTWFDYLYPCNSEMNLAQKQQSNRNTLNILKFCLEVLGAICRTFNEDNKDKVFTIIIFMKNMLATGNLPPDLQETIISSLIRISRHQYNAVADIIMQWTPQFLPSLEFINKLKRFVTLKNADYWKCKRENFLAP